MHLAQPTAYTSNALIKAWSRLGRPDRVAALVADMQAGPGGDQYQPNEMTYSMWISAHAAAGEPEKARLALQAIQAAGTSPGVVPYTCLLNAYGRVCACARGGCGCECGFGLCALNLNNSDCI